MCYYGKQLYPESEFEYDIGFKENCGGTSKYDLFIPAYENKQTLTEVSQITGVSKNIIHTNMTNKVLTSNENRKEILYGKKPIVQLSLSGEFIKNFDSSWEVYEKLGLKVNSCVSGLTRHCHGYLFVKKEDYESGNYNIPEKIRLFNKD